ncbi:MAG: hypothetical protein ACK55D_07315 [Synechococcaceae cyanobacterium]
MASSVFDTQLQRWHLQRIRWAQEGRLTSRLPDFAAADATATAKPVAAIAAEPGGSESGTDGWSLVPDTLPQGELLSTPIAPIYPGRTAHEFRNQRAFAALRSDGSVVAWGNPSFGGDSSGIDFNGDDDTLTVTEIFSASAAFAALRSDGSVVSWGNADLGGNSERVDFDGADNSLTVRRNFSSSGAFAAIRSDGSVVSWGSASSGGDSSSVDFDGADGSLTVSTIVA